MNSIIKKSKRSKLSLPPPPTAPYHTLQINDIIQHLNTNIEGGLTNEEVIETRFPIYGLNELSGQGNVNIFMVLAKQFLNALTLILMIAMIVSFVTKDY